MLLYDDSTGQTTYAEFYPANGDLAPGIYGAGEVNVAINNIIPSLELINGNPSAASIDRALAAINQIQGANAIHGVILPNVNAERALAAASAAQANPPAYSLLDNTCVTFAASTLSAGGADLPSGLWTGPDHYFSSIADGNAQVYWSPGNGQAVTP